MWERMPNRLPDWIPRLGLHGGTCVPPLNSSATRTAGLECGSLLLGSASGSPLGPWACRLVCGPHAFLVSKWLLLNSLIGLEPGGTCLLGFIMPASIHREKHAIPGATLNLMKQSAHKHDVSHFIQAVNFWKHMVVMSITTNSPHQSPARPFGFARFFQLKNWREKRSPQQSPRWKSIGSKPGVWSVKDEVWSGEWGV